MERKRQKLLICGASGFIGRNLAEHFARQGEHEVFGTYFTRPVQIPGVAVQQADLRDARDVHRAVQGMDLLIQAAATTSGAKEIIHKPHFHVTDNAVMNSLIFRAAFEHGLKRVVFFSCSVMYQPGESPVKEEDFDARRELVKSYFGVGWTKVYLEKMCEFYSRIGSAKYTAIRHSNIYGPHDKYDLERSHVFGASVAKVMTSQDGKVVVWGTGEEERDLLYVSDLVDFVDLALRRQESKFELMNVGYGSSIAVRDLVLKIIEASGRDLEMVFDASRPTIKTRLCLDTARANAFGWRRAVPLEEGIRRTLAWYRANIAAG